MIVYVVRKGDTTEAVYRSKLEAYRHALDEEKITEANLSEAEATIIVSGYTIDEAPFYDY